MNRKVLVMITSVGLLGFVAQAEDALKIADTVKPAAAAKAADTIVKTAGAATNTAEATVKAGPAPKIQFDKTVYDFGSTSMVSQLVGKFIISNVGEGTLEIKKPQAACGCTVPALKADKLAPGEKTELAFTLNISSPRGHVEKHITVPSNDPNQPSVKLTLSADIVPTFEATPGNLNLGNLRQGAITNLAVTLTRLDGKPLGTNRVETGGKYLRAKLQPVEGSTNTVELKVEVEAEGAPRQVNDNIRVFSGDNTQPTVIVPISVRFVGDLTTTPEAQFWGIADPENWPGAHPEQAQRKFQIACNKPDTKLEIRKATSTIADVTVEVKPIEEGKTYEVVATLAKAPKQSERGSIKVETNLESQPTVELGLTINVLKRN